MMGCWVVGPAGAIGPEGSLHRALCSLSWRSFAFFHQTRVFSALGSHPSSGVPI